MESEILLSAQNISHSFYLSKTASVRALDKLSFEIRRGEIYGLVGESGSGKSVFTKTFMGLLDQNGWVDSGSIIYSGGKYAGKGVDLVPMKTEKEWLNIRGKEIAMVFQDPMTSLNPLKTIGKQIQETVELHQNLKGEEAKKKTADEIMSVLQAGNVPCTVLRGIGDKYKEQEQLDQCLSNGYLGEGTYESGKHYYQPQIPIYMESVGVQNYFAQSKSIGADNDALFAEFSK